MTVLERIIVGVLVVLLAAVSLYAGASSAGAAPAAVVELDVVASHYAGHPLHVVRGANGLDGYTTPGASTVNLRDLFVDSLADGITPHGRLAGTPAGMTDDAAWWDAIALVTLLHEAAHHAAYGDDERAVVCASVFLFPGALERFYGVPMSSPLGARLWHYATAYNVGRGDCSRFGGGAL